MEAVTCNLTTLHFNEETLSFRISNQGNDWLWDSSFRPRLETKQGTVFFSDAAHISHTPMESGIGKGIVSHYEGFTINGKTSSLAFETICWIEEISGDVFFEFVPLSDEDVETEQLFWPGYMEFDNSSRDWYTLLNVQQGLMIPNNWDVELGKLLFDGLLCTAGSYMPWFGQIKDKNGYIAICEQPWDAAFYAEHPAGGPFTHVGFRWLPSMGHITYRRTVRYSFLSDCDYNDLCKVYRSYTKEKGSFCSLSEKASKAPVDKLIGASFVHKGIKTQVMPDSDFFDPTEPEKNNRVVTFDQRAKEMKSYHDEVGIDKLYLHLDGWAEPGYDNQHPDYPPACEAAGGWNGMKALADTMHECGYLFGIHDQYRDYYFAAKSFQKEFAALQADGTILEHSRWAGGHQTYLCATQAPFYVKRNFSELHSNGIELDCAYLDVFTCNEGDECINPRHRMDRRECFDYRGRCFEYLLSQGILPSSEEVSDWSMKSLVFCHYAPYEFMMEKPDSPRKGIGVPLFNLVYHDCLVIPWMMEKMPEGEDYMLYALLNGGAPYFIRDGAYQNVDGSFDGHEKMSLEQSAERCKTVADLHQTVATCEMVSHQFMDGDFNRQRTVFSNGTKVEIDLEKQSYRITK